MENKKILNSLHEILAWSNGLNQAVSKLIKQLEKEENGKEKTKQKSLSAEVVKSITTARRQRLLKKGTKNK